MNHLTRPLPWLPIALLCLGGAAPLTGAAQVPDANFRLAMTAGVVGGALLGQHLGSRMDKADQFEQQQAAAQAFESAPTGQPVPWNNPDSGHSGQVTPTRTYQRAHGQYCRDYKT